MDEERKRLYKLLYERDKKFEKAKGRRMIVTLIGFAAFYFWLLCEFTEPMGWEIAGELAVAAVFAGIHVFANMLVFGYLANKGREESEILDSIRKRIREIEENRHP